jgi:hypothetical protein
MALYTFKSYFKFATKAWIQVDAIEDRSRGPIPDYFPIDGPGSVDIYPKLQEAVQNKRIAIRVPYSTTRSVIGSEAMKSLDYYYQYQNYNPFFPIWLGIQRYLNGKYIETIRLNDPRASLSSAPSVYANGRYWGQVIDLKIPFPTLFYDI